MRDRDRRTPLLVAIDWDHHDVIDLLIRGGSHLSLPPETLAESMNSAARKGDRRRLESYRRAGANLADKDAAGRTPAHAAAECGQLEVIAYLLDHGFYTESTDVYGHTPKEVANVLGHNELVALIDNFYRPCQEDDSVSLHGSDAGSERGLSTPCNELRALTLDTMGSLSPRQSPTPRDSLCSRDSVLGSTRDSFCSRDSLPGSTRDSLTGYFSASPPMRSDSISGLLSSSPTRRQQLNYSPDSGAIQTLLVHPQMRRNGQILLNGFVS